MQVGGYKLPACFLLLRSVFRRRETACPETLPSWVAPSFAHNPTFANPTFAKHTSCKELGPFLSSIPYKRCVLVDTPPVSAAEPLQEVVSGGQEAVSGERRRPYAFRYAIAICVRLRRPSLARIELMWLRTVPSPM